MIPVIKNIINEKYGSSIQLKVKNKKDCRICKVVPYIDELAQNVDYDKATDKSAGSKLKHMMTLTQKLPEFMAEIKQKYHPIIILDYQNAGEVAETQSKYGED